MEIRLSKLLQVKNRIAGKLGKVQAKVRQYNSTLKAQSGKVDVGVLVGQEAQLKNALLTVKTLIAKTNVAIVHLLIEMAEAKSSATFWSAIPTIDGEQPHSYQNTAVEHVAFLKLKDVTDRQESFERRVVEIQDELDAFNVNTKVEVSEEILNLAK